MGTQVPRDMMKFTTATLAVFCAFMIVGAMARTATVDDVRALRELGVKAGDVPHETSFDLPTLSWPKAMWGTWQLWVPDGDDHKKYDGASYYSESLGMARTDNTVDTENWGKDTPPASSTFASFEGTGSVVKRSKLLRYFVECEDYEQDPMPYPFEGATYMGIGFVQHTLAHAFGNCTFSSESSGNDVVFVDAWTGEPVGLMPFDDKSVLIFDEVHIEEPPQHFFDVPSTLKCAEATQTEMPSVKLFGRWPTEDVAV